MRAPQGPRSRRLPAQAPPRRPPVTDAGALVVLHKQVHLAHAIVKHLNLAVGHPGGGGGGGGDGGDQKQSEDEPVVVAAARSSSRYSGGMAGLLRAGELGSPEQGVKQRRP